jgi:hypothetical protein
MRVKVKEDAIIYVPNSEHKNFTETDKVIEAGSVIEGAPQIIKGKRRGADFDYRMFVTTQGMYIHQNKVERIKEDTIIPSSNADGNTGAEEAVLIQYKEKHMFIYGAMAGALLGVAYSKIFKKDLKHSVILGALAGALGTQIQIMSDKRVLNKKIKK